MLQIADPVEIRSVPTATSSLSGGNRLNTSGFSDSEHSGYKRLKVELKAVFPCLPERSRFNRRRRNLSVASEVLRQALTTYVPKTDVFLVDSFPMPICDFKRVKTSKSELKWADASGTLATYGHCATKGLGTFLGFRGHLMTTDAGGSY